MLCEGETVAVRQDAGIVVMPGNPIGKTLFGVGFLDPDVERACAIFGERVADGAAVVAFDGHGDFVGPALAYRVRVEARAVHGTGENGGFVDHATVSLLQCLSVRSRGSTQCALS